MLKHHSTALSRVVLLKGELLGVPSWQPALEDVGGRDKQKWKLLLLCYYKVNDFQRLKGMKVKPFSKVDIIVKSI